MNLPLSEIVAAWLSPLTEAKAGQALDQLTALDAAIHQSAETRQVLLAPMITRDKKAALLKKAGFDPSVVQFAQYIDANRLWSALPKLVAEAARFVQTQFGVVPATVHSAIELTPKELTKLITSLKKRTNGSVELEQVVQPDLIGGLVVDVAGERLDLSLRGKLNRLKQAAQVL